MSLHETHEDAEHNAPASGLPELEPQDFSRMPDERSRNARLAILGGSFDPLHNAHMFLAGDLVRRGRADEVLFVPARRPPHKGGRILTPAEHRLEMLKQAIEPYDAFSVSDIELVKEDTSYTFDTLTLLSRAYPDHCLFFVMGLDSLVELHEWYRAPELVNRFNFIIYPRPGVHPPAYSNLVRDFGNRNAHKLMDSIMDTSSMPIAATDIRQLVGEEKNLSGLVPESVLAYIKAHKLYKGVAN
ncbi:MAG: nicotinate-nucleotide adenylyltransferase [Lentisphaeria bacterium]